MVKFIQSMFSGGITMKLVLYFGLMVISFVLSLSLGQILLKSLNSLWKSFLLSTLLNVLLLGASSVWWVLTEVDGISQGFGVIYYCFAMMVISIINLKILHTIQKKA